MPTPAVTLHASSSSVIGDPVVASTPIFTFTAPWTIRGTIESCTYSGNLSVGFNLVRSSDGAVCGHYAFLWGLSLAGASHDFVSGSVFPPLTCMDWDTLEFTSGWVPAGQSATVKLELFATPPAYCAYGVEANPDAQIYETLTDITIDTVVAVVLAGVGGPETIPMVETALLALEGSIWFGLRCDVLPEPTQEPLDIANIGTWTPDRLMRWFQVAAWHVFCRCVAAPGGCPPPVLPQPPDIVEPPGAHGPAPLICDATDICTYLTEMRSLLSQMNRQITSIRSDVTFIQRQHVPKGYQGGTLHTALTGTGAFTVSGILGLAVSLTVIPPGAGSDMDSTARTYYGVGHVNVGTADGWLRRIVIGHSPQLVLDIDPDVTRVEYSFMPGTLASIQELLPLA